MGWSLGWDNRWKRDIGYGVPAFCDHPKCNAQIDRGLGFVCCAQEPYGGEHGCGLYFCGKHGGFDHKCPRCRNYKPPYNAKPDHPEWITHKLTDPSWAEWRAENDEWVLEQSNMLTSNHSDAVVTDDHTASSPTEPRG